MQQPTAHYSNNGVYGNNGVYSNNGVYPQGPPSDSSNPQAYMASYGSAPPYTSSPLFYSDRSSHQSAPQAPPYVLAESMGSLHISPQGSYAAATPPGAFAQGSHAPAVHSETSVSYTPAITSYDQSYGAVAGLLHPQTPPSQPPSYSSATGFPDAPPFPQAGYDPHPSYFAGSYSSNPPSNYEAALPLMGSYDTSNNQILASQQSYDSQVSGIGSGNGSSSSEARSYAASQQAMQGYDYPSGGPLNVYDHGNVNYGASMHSSDYDRPAYSTTQAYDGNYYKSNGLDRMPGNNAHDFDDMNLGEVYAYDGGNVEPYGARGSGTGGSWGAIENRGSGGFGTYGNSGSSGLPKAVPKVEHEEKQSGAPKYQVKVLSDGSSGSPQNLLCQVGLDGVRMISPSNSKTVQIYPLETITRWEVSEPSVFTFWAKSAVDPEPRRIRLQSGSYTTNAILDTLTAACVQFSEMVEKVDPKKTPPDVDKSSDSSLENRKPLPLIANWIALRNKQLAPEEKQHWVPDEAATKCSGCSSDFGPFLRRHHCRNCGDVFCDKCTNGRTALTADEDAPVVRVCDHCLAEVTQRLSNAKEISNRPVSAPCSHEGLAKRLQEEMERNSSKRSTTTSSIAEGKEKLGQTSVLNCSACGSISLVLGSSTRCPNCGLDSSNARRDSSKGVSSSSSDGSTKRMREVACPTCTVHLQVQVPSSGTETVECGVCQHPFLVNAH